MTAVIVSEGGSIDVYPSTAKARDALEAIDVEAGAYEAFDATGRKLELKAVEWKVVIEPSNDATDYSEEVLALVRAHAHRVRRPRALSGPEIDNSSLQQLVAMLLGH